MTKSSFHQSARSKSSKLIATVAMGSLLWPGVSLGHSVAQVQTAKRLAESTIVFLDPQGNPTGGSGVGSNTTAQVGDILTFVLQFTPVPNGATRGAGGYITEYVPDNMEVVGARFIDRNGNTIRPQRGPQMDDGWGPRGDHGYDLVGDGLEEGNMSALYADTGIFFSRDPRTARLPVDDFVRLENGIVLRGDPTGAGGLRDVLGHSGTQYYAHNLWDAIQVEAFGIGNSFLSDANGQGNAPHLFGSAVAGPQTYYSFDVGGIPQCSDGISNVRMDWWTFRPIPIV